jgi:hypothetical protein
MPRTGTARPRSVAVPLTAGPPGGARRRWCAPGSPTGQSPRSPAKNAPSTASPEHWGWAPSLGPRGQRRPRRARPPGACWRAWWSRRRVGGAASTAGTCWAKRHGSMPGSAGTDVGRRRDVGWRVRSPPSWRWSNTKTGCVTIPRCSVPAVAGPWVRSGSGRPGGPMRSTGGIVATARAPAAPERGGPGTDRPSRTASRHAVTALRPARRGGVHRRGL